MQMHAANLVALRISLSLSAAVSGNVDPARNVLIGKSDHFFHLVILSAVIVAVGCILEIGEATVEGLHWWWKKKDKPFLDDDSRWTIPLSIVGLILVIAGVAGEGYFEPRQSNAETAVREYDEKVLADAI